MCSGGDRQLLNPNRNTALSQILLAVIERCVCMCDLLWCLAYTTCICSLSWALTSQSPPGKHSLRACSAFRSLFSSILFLQVRTVCLIMFLSVLSLSAFGSLVCVHFLLSLLFPVCSASPSRLPLLSPGVELNLGRLTLTDWLMCGFCHLCLNKCEPFCAGWEPVSIWLF